MHQLSGFNKKIMTSQIKHCWKGMCVGGKGVTRGRQRLSLEAADNEEMVEFPSNRFQTSLASVCVLAFASPCKIHTRAEQCAAHLALGVKGGSFNPSHSCNNHITTSLVTKIKQKELHTPRCIQEPTVLSMVQTSVYVVFSPICNVQSFWSTSRGPKT